MASAIPLFRLARILEMRGATGKTKLYGEIKDGLYTPPIKLGGRASMWPENEVAALNAAAIAGFNKGQIRELVKQLLAKRAELAKQVAA